MASTTCDIDNLVHVFEPSPNRIGISGAALLPSYNLSEDAAQQAGSNAQLSLSILKQKGVPLLGSPSAHITIIEFADFQCPFCARFARDIQPQINQTYIQTGNMMAQILYSCCK